MTPICERCGNCCHYPGKNGKMRKCKHLVRLSSGRTLCRNYRNRLYSEMGTDEDGNTYFCSMREDVKFNFLGCPYNVVGWPTWGESIPVNGEVKKNGKS